MQNLDTDITSVEFEEENNIFNPQSLSELMSKEFRDAEWVVEKLIPSEGIVAISGLPSAYKTWFVLQMSLTIAKGGILFDQFDTKRKGLLLIDEETGDRWIQQRFKKLSQENILPIYVLSKSGFLLTKKSVDQLLSFCRENSIGVVIFDSFVRISTARDENSATEVAKVFRLFQQLTKEGVTVLFTHHNRKPGLLRSSNLSQDMRGSSDILAAVDSHIAIERKDEYIVVTQTKSRQGEELQPFKLNIINDENEFRFEYAGELDEIKSKKEDFIKAITELLQNKKTALYKKELHETLKKAGMDGGYTTFKSAVTEMIQKGLLYQQKGERNKVFISLTPFDIQQDLTNVGNSQNSKNIYTL